MCEVSDGLAPHGVVCRTPAGKTLFIRRHLLQWECIAYCFFLTFVTPLVLTYQSNFVGHCRQGAASNWGQWFSADFIFCDWTRHRWYLVLWPTDWLSLSQEGCTACPWCDSVGDHYIFVSFVLHRAFKSGLAYLAYRLSAKIEYYSVDLFLFRFSLLANGRLNALEEAVVPLRQQAPGDAN